MDDVISLLLLQYKQTHGVVILSCPGVGNDGRVSFSPLPTDACALKENQTEKGLNCSLRGTRFRLKISDFHFN